MPIKGAVVGGTVAFTTTEQEVVLDAISKYVLFCPDTDCLISINDNTHYIAYPAMSERTIMLTDGIYSFFVKGATSSGNLTHYDMR